VIFGKVPFMAVMRKAVTQTSLSPTAIMMEKAAELFFSRDY
jgi:hypothetical protein